MKEERERILGFMRKHGLKAGRWADAHVGGIAHTGQRSHRRPLTNKTARTASRPRGPFSVWSAPKVQNALKPITKDRHVTQ